MPLIRVSLKNRSYAIVIGKNLISNAGHWIKHHGVSRRDAIVVSQKEVLGFYENALSDSLLKEGFQTSFFVPAAAKSSEAAKSQTVFLKLIKKIAATDGKNKSVFLVALGGGVIGDLTGFAAAVYRRGIPYIQIPTTLTAQVDSAIGGKTAIDLPEGKNLLGAIHQPALVLSDLGALNSLPDRRWRDGFAEIIKYGVIKNARLFSFLEKTGLETVKTNNRQLEKIISSCVKIKAKIVEQDEWDKKDIRIALNFGHTIGHAIETASQFSGGYTHGEAVAIGMLAACDISEKIGLLKEKELPLRLEKTLIKFNLPVYHKGLSLDLILKAIGYDKKSVTGSNRFVLPVSLGKMAVVKDVPVPTIVEAIQKRKG